MLPVTTEITNRCATVEFDANLLSRYSRHILLPEVGLGGQQRLSKAKVLIVGLGGLGSPVALYLGAAGVGRLGLVDADTIDASNLQRQILYREADIGRPKVAVAADVLKNQNSAVEVMTYEEMFNPVNALRLISEYDLVIDGSDNFATRYLVNDACVLAGKPLIFGSILRFIGQTSVFYAPHGPCYRCLFPTPPAPGQVPSCAEGGVLGVLPGIIGTVQATEAVKLLLGIGQSLIGRILTYDALQMSWKEVTLTRDPDCPICGNTPTIHSLERAEISCDVPVASTPLWQLPVEIDVDEFSVIRSSKETYVLLDVRNDEEAQICQISGSLLIPLSALTKRLAEIAKDKHLIVYCKTGGRSFEAVKLLRERGYKQAQSLRGGIIQWIEKYDPTLARY